LRAARIGGLGFIEFEFHEQALATVQPLGELSYTTLGGTNNELPTLTFGIACNKPRE
jgi:hypothetical protein